MTDLSPVILAADADSWSAALAMVMGFVFLGGLALIIAFNRWTRPDLDKDHARHILSQLDSFGGTGGASVVIRGTAELADPDRVDDIRALFNGERREDRARDETVRALSEITREVRAELSERSPSLPRVPVRAVQEAILTAVFGAVVIVPLAAWQSATESSGPGVPTLAEFLAALGSVLDAFVSLITAFPFTDVLFGLAVAGGVTTANLVWTAWMVPPLVLITLAAAYLALDRRVETELEPTGPSISGWTRRTVTLAALVWFVGTGFAFVGGLIPGPMARAAVSVILTALVVSSSVVLSRRTARDESEDEDLDEDADSAPSVNWKRTAALTWFTLPLGHDIMAFLAAAVAALFVVFEFWIPATTSRWKQSASEHGRDAFALDVIHSLTVTAAALTLPLMVGYAAAAVGTGKIVQVGGVIAAAAPETVLAVGVLAVILAIAGVFLFADRFAGVRRGVQRALSISAVRVVLIKRGFPAIFGVLAAVLLLAFGLPLAAVLAGGLAAGFVARGGVLAWNTVSYRASQYSGMDRTAARVVINGRTITDADGEPVFVADANGHRTAHRDLDLLVDQITRDTRSLLMNGHAERGSFPRYYYQNGVQRGKVDVESVANELVGDIRTRFRANVINDTADASAILTKLNEEYPEQAVRRVVRSLKDRGRVTRREDRFVWMGE